ncbi:MAG TPA: AAA family ATPase [Bradyrhizobium sp.]|jgi:hypothetical protein
MKLVSVTIENFRSITAARKIQLSQLTTLVGPNNEGKSNILRAIVIAMKLLVARRGIEHNPRHFSPRTSRYRRQELARYDWDSDCPLNLQKKGPKNGSKITLEFELTVTDIGEFYDRIGSRLNGTLPISMTFAKDEVGVSIAKQGRAGRALSGKAIRIADFLATKIDIQYIPAVRTAQSAQEIVEYLVERELAKVESDPKYRQALMDIAALQQPVLDGLSKNITETMRGFLPRITQAKVIIEERDRSFALRGVSAILLDDGVETLLQAKGDGVQSLAALALMRHSSQSRSEGKEVLIALEEPESHLHPSAIRQLRDVLNELSVNSQVVLTTHNAIFTNREDVGQNIIVKQNRADPAKSVKEVRDILGVRLDDNLTSAEVVLIVEGQEDKIVISSMLSSDPRLKLCMNTGRMAIDVLGGSGNLSHRVRLHLDNVCKVHALLDDDQPGRSSFEAARAEGLLDVDSVNFTSTGGKRDAELEDLYKESVFVDLIKQETGLDWASSVPEERKKWTDRLRTVLRKAGKPLDELTIMAIKIKVARAAADLGEEALHGSKAGPITSLKNALLAKLGEVSSTDLSKSHYATAARGLKSRRPRERADLEAGGRVLNSGCLLARE